MVTNPLLPEEPPLHHTPNAIVLGEMTMTTNNTDEEEKGPGQTRELRDSCLVNIEEDGGASSIIKRRPESTSSAKVAEGRNKQIEKHVNRMSMSKI